MRNLQLIKQDYKTCSYATFGYRIALVLLAFSLASITKSFAQSTKTLTYEESVTLALTNNYSIKEANLERLQKEEELNANKGLRYPTIAISGSYMRMSDDIHMDLTPVKNAISPLYSALGHYGQFSGVANPDPLTNKILPYFNEAISTPLVRNQLLDGLKTINTTSWDEMIQKKQFGMIDASFTWPLFTGGKIAAANQASKIYLKISKDNILVKNNEVLKELTERYYGLVLAQQVSLIREDVMKNMETHLSNANKLKTEGLIANTEYLHAKVYTSESYREVAKASRQVKIINSGLCNTLSIDSTINFTTISKLFYIPLIESIDSFYNWANKESPLLEKVRSNKELAHQGLKVEQASWYPTLFTMGTYNLANQDLSPYIPGWVVGVGMKWTIFDGATMFYKASAAKIKEKQVDEYYLKANADINTAISKYYQELILQTEQLKELETSLSFANEYCLAQNNAFKEGIATSVEVVDANLMLAKVKIERLQVMYAYDMALNNLLYYSGKTADFAKYQHRNDVVFENYK